MKKILALIAAGALAIGGLLATSTPATAYVGTGPLNGFNAAPSARPWLGTFDANTDGWFAPNSATRVQRDVALMKSAGADVVRVEFPWYLIEPSNGTYDWSKVDTIVSAVKSAGLRLHIQAFYTPQWAAIRGNSTPGTACQFTYNLYTSSAPTSGTYGTFLTDLVNHVQSTNPGGIDFIEVGNEFDLNQYWSSSNTYAEYLNNMLKPAYQAVKAIDPSIKIILGGIAQAPGTTFLDGVMNAGASGYFDILSFHSYSGTNAVVNAAQTYRTYLNNKGLSAVPVWVTEFGTSDATVNDNNHVNLLNAVLASGAVAGAEWYEIADDDVYATATTICQREYYGIVTHDAVLKAGYGAWQSAVGGGPVVSVNDNTTGTANQTISYAGTWATGTGSDGRSDGTTHYSHTANSTATMTFTGRRVQVFSNTSQGGGRATISVDGGPATTIDTYSGVYRTNQLVFDSGLLSGTTHTVVVKVLGTANSSSTNSWVDFDRFVAYSATPSITDDATTGSGANQFAYSGGWSVTTGSTDGRYARTTHWTNTAGSTATTTVVGSRIDVRANRSGGGGKATISIDGGAPVTVDTYSSTFAPDSSIYLSGALSYGPHTVVITVTGTASSGSNNSWIDFDRIVTQ